MKRDEEREKETKAGGKGERRRNVENTVGKRNCGEEEGAEMRKEEK